MSDSMSQAEAQGAGSGSVRLHCLGDVSDSGVNHLSELSFG
jgi:hypothetical protein